MLKQSRLRRQYNLQQSFPPTAEHVTRPKLRVALNVYLDPNVAPAQQRNSYLMPCAEAW